MDAQNKVKFCIIILCLILGTVLVLIVGRIGRQASDSASTKMNGQNIPSAKPTKNQSLGQNRNQEIKSKFLSNAHIDDEQYQLNNKVESPYTISQISELLGKATLQQDALRRAEEIKRIAAIMATEFPEQALEYLETFPFSDEDLTIFADAVVASLLDQGSDVAAAWSERIENVPLRFREIQTVGNHWASEDLEVAVEWSDNIEDLTSANAAKMGIAAVWAEKDLEKAQTWAHSIGHPFVRGQVLRTVGFVHMEKDVREAADWALETVFEMQPRIEILENAITVWSRRDREAATDWIENIDHPETQELLVGPHAAGWAQDDPLSAAAWVLQFPNSRMRNSNIIAVLSSFANSEPEEAMLWASSNLTDSQLRDAALQQVAGIWADYDPDGVRSWIKNSMDETTSSMLLEALGQKDTVTQ